MDVRVDRKWATGTMAMSAKTGVASGMADGSVGEGASLGAGETAAVGAACEGATTAWSLEAGAGDGLAPNPSRPPLTGTATASAITPTTINRGRRLTARIVPEGKRTPRPGGRTGRGWML